MYEEEYENELEKYFLNLFEEEVLEKSTDEEYGIYILENHLDHFIEDLKNLNPHITQKHIEELISIFKEEINPYFLNKWENYYKQETSYYIKKFDIISNELLKYSDVLEFRNLKINKLYKR